MTTADPFHRSPPRTTLVVAAWHGVVLLVFLVPALFRTPPPQMVRVKLAQPAPERAPSPTHPAPAEPSRAEPEPAPAEPQSAPRPPEPASTPPERTTPAPSESTPWRARSAEDIRNSATLDPAPAATERTVTNPRPNTEGLREALRESTEVTVTPVSASAAPAQWRSSEYAAALRNRLDAAWSQPAGQRGQKASARLRIRRDGGVVHTQLLAADTVEIRRSVQAMLDSLTRLPAPQSYGYDQAVITLTVDLRLEE